MSCCAATRNFKHPPTQRRDFFFNVKHFTLCGANGTDFEGTEHSLSQWLFPSTNMYECLLLMCALKPFLLLANCSAGGNCVLGGAARDAHGGFQIRQLCNLGFDATRRALRIYNSWANRRREGQQAFTCSVWFCSGRS